MLLWHSNLKKKSFGEGALHDLFLPNPGLIKNLTTEWNKIQRHFIPHASRSLLCIRFVAVAFWSKEEVFLRRGPPCDLFLPCPVDPPLGRYGQNTLCWP